MALDTSNSKKKHFKRSPSSIISSDSDIRFTRQKLNSNYKCGCCIIACFFCFLLIAACTLYVTYTYLLPDPPEEQQFRAMFRIVGNEKIDPRLLDATSENFHIYTKNFEEKISEVIQNSDLANRFISVEVLALDGNDGNDLTVHFSIRLYSNCDEIEAHDIKNILSRDVTKIFINGSVDYISVQNNNCETTTLALSSTKSTSSYNTIIPLPPKICTTMELKYCSNLPYNITSYPNVLGHRSYKDVAKDLISFRELIDAECYKLAYNFVCQILQPECVHQRNNDEIILPCRSYCRDFMSGCAGRLSDQLKKKLDCYNFPEYSESASCHSKPNCVNDLQEQGRSNRICDGIIDCEDISDEKACPYCSKGYLHCGIGRACIPNNFICDGKIDCPNGSDEQKCLSISNNTYKLEKNNFMAPHQIQYDSGGYVIFNEKGKSGKVCAENLMNIPDEMRNNILQSFASSLCKSLSYSNASSVGITEDQDENVSYVSIKDPRANKISFIRSPCLSKQVIHVECPEIECGLQSVYSVVNTQVLNKIASPGDWPWHVALFREEIHVCDGTLVSSNWIVTTASCFQGQVKAKWTARLGILRISGVSPWQQERRIVGLVKSLVEGSTIAMIKMETPVLFSDFVRPICLPMHNQVILPTNMSFCNTLGWSQNRDQLQRVQLRQTDMKKCENVSITTVNSLCTETPYSKNDCNEEELAGSPMICLLPDGIRWSLVGISNWRIACSKGDIERPRMYDKVTSNVDWINQTINAISNQ